MKIKENFTWILFLPLLLACGLFSSPPTPFPANSYIEGLWVPSKYTLEFMDQSGYEFEIHSIEFLPYGIVIMTNIPKAWIFQEETSSMDFYSGNGIWSLSKQMVTTMGEIQPVVNVYESGGEDATIEFGTVLEYLEFIPANNPKEVNWVTFQKCYPHLHITDDLLEPLVKALSQSPRDTFGFSPITIEDRIEINGTLGEDDIWLNAYNDFSSHGIFFKLNNHEYIWIHESESFKGPETWRDSDGATWEETIYLQYQTEDINGGPINDLMVDYIGHDQRLLNTTDNWYLSNNIDSVLPIIEEWREWRANEPPSSQALCP